MAEKLHSFPALAAKARPGCDLTISYGCTAVTPPEAEPKRKKRSLLPALTFLFVVSYSLMTVLIIEQGSAIQSQHNLIQVLMRDSSELWISKGKALGDHAVHAQAPAGKTQTPAAQAPAGHAPAGQVPKHRSQNPASKAVTPGVELPPAPASDLVDRRRSLSTI